MSEKIHIGGVLRDGIHIGSLIHNKLKEDGRSVSWLARKLHYERANIYRLLKRPSIDTHLLYRISKILEHDFFLYYSDIYKNI